MIVDYVLKEQPLQCQMFVSQVSVIHSENLVIVEYIENGVPCAMRFKLSETIYFNIKPD